jgi:hypothetical protein
MNRINRYNKYKYLKKPLTGLFSLLLLSALAGCFSQHGNIRWNSEATDAFRFYNIMENHKYYYSGGDARPNAIIAIHQNYTLVPELWKEADVSRERLKKWVDQMVGHDIFRSSPAGFTIYDSNGNRIGIWYSMWDWTSVKMESDNRVYITTPGTTSKKSRRLRSWIKN